MKECRKPDIREKVLKNGLTFPTDEELIMLLLGSGIQGMPVKQMAKKVLGTVSESHAETLIQSLLSITGIGPSKALLVGAAIEFGRRQNAATGKKIQTPADLVPFLQHYSMQTKEHFVCVTLNGAYEIIKIRSVSVGTINRTVVHPREVFTDAVKDMAAAVILCHNHPSGSEAPSETDIETTEKLMIAAEYIGIKILDHIIVTQKTYYSFKEHNLIPENGTE
ncbi:RadC family protein [Treponema brennaborense]|uniref:DNA repair protein RadC n=1 Tax=Treponema brennaborense (strain DSM 12168 / CIP 105900 / DD5/3) TaxID=906968 RepID=F4LNQ7_TREBD|nr:DNA repair protein RadC [Treponema brennaborense]AEE16892.1 DNA repair protein RadC [Treponema brennaborense DSM 12168]